MNREIIIKMQLIPPLRYQLHEPWFVDNSSSKFCVETITNGSRKPLLATEIRCYYYYYYFFPRLAHGILCSLLLLTTAIRQKKKNRLKMPSNLYLTVADYRSWDHYFPNIWYPNLNRDSWRYAVSSAYFFSIFFLKMKFWR